MIREFSVIYIAVWLLFTSFTRVEVFPVDVVKREFRNLVSDGSSLSALNLNIQSVEPLADAHLKAFLPHTEFYCFTMFIGEHFEYNFGNIYAIAAVSTTDTLDVRLLLPQDYAKCSVDFFDLFYTLRIENRELTCKSITNLFQRTYINHSFNCVDEMLNWNQTIDSTENTFSVYTQGNLLCKYIYEKPKQFVVSKSTVFTFEGDKLAAIEYKDWRN